MTQNENEYKGENLMLWKIEVYTSRKGKETQKVIK